MSDRPRAALTILKLAGYCLLAGVVATALMFPFAGGLGLVSNRASDVVANGSAQLLEGEVPAVSTMVDAKGNTIAWLYSQRRFEVPSDKIANTMKLAIVSIEDKRFADHNGVDWKGTLTGLAGYASRRRRHPRRFDHRAAVRQELPVAGDRADRRREARRRGDHPRAQAARDPDGAHAGQDLHQARDPHPLPEPGVVRQRRVRRAGRGADLLRHQRLGPELAAGGAAGGHGAVDQRAQPLHQPRRRVGAAKLGAGHHDREHPAGGRRAARRQGQPAGHAAAAQRAAARLHRGRRSRVLLRLRAGVPVPRRDQQGTGRPRRLPDPHHAGPGRAGPGQGGHRPVRQPDAAGHRQRDERDPARQDVAQGDGDGQQPHLRPEPRRRRNHAAAAVLPGRRRRGVDLQDLHHGRRPGHGHGHQRHARGAGPIPGQGHG